MIKKSDKIIGALIYAAMVVSISIGVAILAVKAAWWLLNY